MTVIFLHIPKTAGTSFSRSLRDEYGSGFHRIRDNRADPTGLEEFRNLSKDGIEAVASHVAYGIHRDIPGPVQYITILRHPDSRILSDYRFILRHDDHVLHESIATAGSLANYTSKRQVASHDNLQTRIVAGGMNIGTQPFDRPVGIHDLERAVANLDRFAFVGLMERYDETLLSAAKILRWSKWPVTYYDNRAPDAGSEYVDPQLTRFDWQLYEEAERRFQCLASNGRIGVHRLWSRFQHVLPPPVGRRS